MRKLMIATISCVALAVTTPALAQGRGGGAPGGGPGGGAGAGPPMTPPGQMGMGSGTADYARGNIADQRGQFGRDFADRQRDQAMQRVEQYSSRADVRRAEALAMADAARAGRPIRADAANVRRAFEQDLKAWRDAFRIDRTGWQQQRQQWLDSRGDMSAAEWAVLRANWFAARDAWIQQQVGLAQSRAQ